MKHWMRAREASPTPTMDAAGWAKDGDYGRLLAAETGTQNGLPVRGRGVRESRHLLHQRLLSVTYLRYQVRARRLQKLVGRANPNHCEADPFSTGASRVGVGRPRPTHTPLPPLAQGAARLELKLAHDPGPLMSHPSGRPPARPPVRLSLANYLLGARVGFRGSERQPYLTSSSQQQPAPRL